MTTQAAPPDKKCKHSIFIDKYVRFDTPSTMPSMLISWHEPLKKSLEVALGYGLRVETVNKPVEAFEVIGRKTRMLMRDHALAGRQQPDGDIQLYDQFTVLEMDSEEDANAFLEVLIAKINDSALKISVSERSSKTRRFVIESILGYRLYCVTVINSLFDLANADKVDLFIHWMMDYDKSAWKSNNKASSCDLFDSAEIT